MIHRIYVLFIVLFALGARLYGIEAIRQEEDWARPHGQGIVILENITAGRYSELPILYLPSGIGLPNPPAVAYFWALVALIDRSPYSALAIVSMLSVMGIAMLYDLGRRLFSPTCGAMAALLAASSPWAIYHVHGTWIQAFLEFVCITSGWFIFIAIQQNNRRRMFAGLALTALFMQTYLMAIALLIQVGTACWYAFLTRRSLLKPIVVGVGLCILSAMVYLTTLYASNPDFLRDLRAGVKNSPATIPSLPNPFGIHLDLAGINHSLRIVSGRDYENAWTDPNHPDFALRNQLNDIRASVVELLVGLGAIILLLRIRRDVNSAILLTWFGLPAVLVTVALILEPNLYPEQWYLLITAPAGYLLAGVPFMTYKRARIFHRPVLAPVMQSMLAVAGMVAMLIPAANLVAHYNTVLESPFRTSYLETLSLRYQLKLGALWRKECSKIDNPQTILWVISIYGSQYNVQPEASRVIGQSDVWQVLPEGGNCVTRMAGEPAALNADTYPLTLSNGAVLTTYRSRPVSVTTGFTPLVVNLGWTLVDLQTTPTAQPGDTVTVTHIWRVEHLPQEPYAAWYFAPFVNLIGLDGQHKLMVDNAPSIIGAAWRPGDYIISTIRFKIPVNSTTGQYKLELSLFDPNQKKNAVYFDPAEPGIPIVKLERQLQLR